VFGCCFGGVGEVGMDLLGVILGIRGLLFFGVCVTCGFGTVWKGSGILTLSWVGRVESLAI